MKRLLWIAVACCAAWAMAHVARLVRPGEPVNAVWLLVAATCTYALGYRFYCAFVAARVLALDPARPTAATRLDDGIDYHPTNRWIVFGHHFAAISGAGPLIGPTLAAQFGYLPGFLWMLVGATLAGSVHDLVVLAASVRREGRSLAELAREEIGRSSGIAVAFIILFGMVVGVAGSALAVVNALSGSPWGTFTVALTIPIAVGMGLYLRHVRPGRVGEASLLGVGLLLAAVVAGRWVPGSWLAPAFTISGGPLLLCLCVLCFFSSSLPVWLLLVPRDYISSYLKLGTFALLALAVVVLGPALRMPAVTEFVHGGGPIVPGPVYPFLFITIACGAISGMHSLIATGTTPKMVASEAHLPLVGFGAMLAEGVVGVLALIAATTMLPGDFLGINTHLPPALFAELGLGQESLAELSRLVGADVAGRPGGSVSLAVGMTRLLSGLLGGASLAPYWYNFSLLFQALFILTVVDAGTRVGRMLLQELGGHLHPALRRRGPVSIYLASLAVVALWGFMVQTGSVSTIWPMFGVANQILATTALGIGTGLILRSGRGRYAWVTLVPMAFMTVTSLIAAWQLVGLFAARARVAESTAVAVSLRVNIALVVAVALAALVNLAETGRRWAGALREPRAGAGGTREET